MEKLEEIAKNDPILQQAFESWEALSADKERRQQYEACLKYMLDKCADQVEAERQAKKAREEGIQEGIEKGKKSDGETFIRARL